MTSTPDNERFMRKALELAETALDQGEFPVGCVLVYQGSILTTGFRKGTAGGSANETDHAEMTALRRLGRLTENIDPAHISLFCTMEPCLMCFGAILLSGIGRIVYAYEDIMGGGTRCDLSMLSPLYSERKITIIPDVLRNESLKLFRTFFQNPDNVYWKGSLLAEYTLKQSVT